jgi:hypothetical protein
MKSTTSSISRCHYIKTNGEVCGSPALRGRGYCYYHHEAAKRDQRRARFASANSIDIELPQFEDPESIQVGISEVCLALLDRRVDPRTATTLLYSMQLAISNLKNLSNAPRKLRSYVVDVPPNDYFEADFVADDPDRELDSTPKEPEACKTCPEDNICDDCEHYIDPIEAEFPSLEVVPRPMGTHTRKPPVPAHELASIDRDLQAAARGDQSATRRLHNLQLLPAAPDPVACHSMRTDTVGGPCKP